MGNPEYMKFSFEEYKNRYEKAQFLMKEKNLKGLLITEGNNYTYFSGATRDFSYTRPHILLLPSKGKPVAIIQNFPSWNRKREIWFDDVRVYETPLGLPLDIVIKAMKDCRMVEGKIGVEIGYEQRLGITFNDFIKLKDSLLKVDFVDASDIFWGIRMIKSSEEINRHRKACQITAGSYETIFSTIHNGMNETEIFDKFLKLLVANGGCNQWAFINSGKENYAGGGGGPIDRYIKKGDQVWIDGGCSYKGYYSDFCCSGIVGFPSKEQEQMQKMIEEITGAVVDSIKPGIKACEIHAVNNAEWEKRGYDYKKINWAGGRIGHGLGLGFEPPHIAEYDNTVIKKGMVFTIEPAINKPYGCYQTEMIITVTENGYKILNEMDRSLRIIAL